jgi:hypothetical protein
MPSRQDATLGRQLVHITLGGMRGRVGVSPLPRHQVGSKVASKFLADSIEALHMNLVILSALPAVFSNEKCEGRAFWQNLGLLCQQKLPHILHIGNNTLELEYNVAFIFCLAHSLSFWYFSP